MHTINTRVNFVSRFRLHASRFIFKPGAWGVQRVAGVCIIFSFCILNLVSGCVQKSSLEKAQDYAQQSQAYYQAAIVEYNKLISQGKDLDRLYFELGKLCFSHGDFNQAQEALKKSSIKEAKKFLAIAHYKLGNFTDALEVFSKNEILDDEYLYYYGLTCEKLNLFDRALETYNKIKEPRFKTKVVKRINLIEKQANLLRLENIDPQVNKILSGALQKEQYPQAGALILFCDEHIEITPEYTQVSYLHYIVKILNERGKEDFSETHITYDSTYEKVELEYARTIKPDGTVVEVGSRHIRDVSRYLNFPLYSNARVYIISFPEITEGASIEYKVKIYRYQLINKKDFIVSYPVQTSEPVMLANFSITLPKQNPLHIKILNEKYNNFAAKLNPDIKEESNFLIYSWQFKDIPQIIPESGMPANAQINPTILVSTFSSWQEVYNWWWSLAKDKIEADTAIKEKVRELTKGLDSNEAKIRAIYNFCAQKIRYVAVEYGQAGYQPHNAGDTFRNKYGDCKDQTILLVTMLKEAGFLAFPGLIPTKEYYDLTEDFPAVFFNHCIATVALNGKIIFLDPTAQTCAFGDLPSDDQGRKVLVFKEDRFEIQDIPLYPAIHNLIKQILSLKVNKDESITVVKDNFTYGVYDQAQRLWLLYTQPELIEEALKEAIQDVSIGARLDKYQIKNLDNLNEPIVLSYAFRGPEYFTPAGALRIMPQIASLDTSLVAKDKRSYPIDFNILDTKETMLEIELPSNFAIRYIPESVSEDSPWLKFVVEYSRKTNKIYFKQRIELKKNKVQEAEYIDFKNFLQGLAKKIKQRIVLERIR